MCVFKYANDYVSSMHSVLCLSLSPPPLLHTHTLESASSGASDSGSDDDEGTATATAAGALTDPQKLQEMAGVDAEGLSGDAMSKAKQSRSEKKARKAMLKLGLKSHPGQ